MVLSPGPFLEKSVRVNESPIPALFDKIFFTMSMIHLGFGTTIVAIKYKTNYALEARHKVSVFVPIFNEEKTLERSIHALEYIVKKIPVEYEIFIVNDASDDQTMLISRAIEHANGKVLLLNYDLGPTRRENLAQSFKKASGDIIVFIDVDMLKSLRLLRDLIDQIILGHDIAIGSRYISGSRTKRKLSRLLVSLLYNFAIRLIFKTNIYDHMCGFKAFKKSVILTIVEEMGYDRSLKRGIFWDTELLLRAIRHGYKIKEIPIWWNERHESKLYLKREIITIGYVIKFIKTWNNLR